MVINDPFILLAFKLFFLKSFVLQKYFLYLICLLQKNHEIWEQVGFNVINNFFYFFYEVVTIFFESSGVFLLSFGIF